MGTLKKKIMKRDARILTVPSPLATGPKDRAGPAPLSFWQGLPWRRDPVTASFKFPLLCETNTNSANFCLPALPWFGLNVCRRDPETELLGIYPSAYLCPKSICSNLFIGVFFFFCFLEPCLQYMEVPRLGVKSELQLPAYTIAAAMWDPRHICDLHHSSQQHQIPSPLRPRIRLTFLWIIVRFVSAAL